MGIGDFLASFGEAYATIVAVVASVVCTYLLYLTMNNRFSFQKATKADIAFGLIFVVGLTWLFVWLTKKYRPFAQVEGIIGGVNIFQALASAL